MFKKNKNKERVIYEQYYEKVYQIAYFITKEKESAQDVTQETFIKAFKNLHTLEDEKKIEPWLKTITRRTAIDFLRKKKRWNETPTDDVYLEKGEVELESEVEKNFEENELMNRIKEAINKLSPNHRDILYLKFIEAMSEQEIANELKIKTGTVKSRLHRAKIVLRSELENGGGLDG